MKSNIACHVDPLLLPSQKRLTDFILSDITVSKLIFDSCQKDYHLSFKNVRIQK